uniref:phosphogluconate dehydrogenase (NADP(+)-dependent, decarboxylating) n=1 Tax=Dermatophagoides pteronyssinus TaxID=6956 RepID=A0A6P6XMB9_DERPT|nr:uncharacterized protein LOC113788659 [Dermatophagoides pteronyssinus]
MTKSDIGVIGMGVMGSNLALNLVEHGVSTSIYNRSYEKTEATYEKAKNIISNDAMQAFKTLEDFVDSLAFPRKVIIIITSGEATDAMINALIPLLSKGDIILEASNAYYKDTLRRMEVLKAVGIHNLGVGVSGGEEGARNGASIMVGGDAQVYALVEPFLAKAAAESVFGKCVARVGDKASGHFVKMIHNGIEYAIMEFIAEIYMLFVEVYKFSAGEISEIFDKYNNTKLKSYLMEISSIVTKTKNPDNPKEFLIDNVLDIAGAKGTGKWTIQESVAYDYPCPTIAAAVYMRNISGWKKLRLEYNKLPPTPKEFIKHVEESLYGAVLVAHLEGLMLMKHISEKLNFNVDFLNVLKVWANGCILRKTSIEFSTVLLIELEVAGVELTVPLAEFFESSCIPVEF